MKGYLYEEGRFREVEFSLPPEAELEVMINERPLVRLAYTPGAETELVLGHLWTGDFIEGLDGIQWRFEDAEGRFFVELPEAPAKRIPKIGAGCGGAAGFSGPKKPLPEAQLAPETPLSIVRTLHQKTRIYPKTRGIHAAALFDRKGRLLAHFEDIGRHNALDRLAGTVLLQGLRGPFLIAVTGRITYEMAEKAIRLGAILAASRTGASDRAVRLARAFKLAVAAYVRGRRYRLYTGVERFTGTSRTAAYLYSGIRESGS